ncbi:MAG TPA: ThuA domain-containing protein [Verrucomicrobiae bacterium]|nr:ThuA domain-containing protein [Verrucomicrobiae bacterium]
MKLSIAIFCAGLLLVPTFASAADAPKKLLVVTTTAGFRHSSIPTAEKVLSELAEKSKAFTVEFVRQPEGKLSAVGGPSAETRAALQEELKAPLSKLSAESLKNYDGIIFANTTGDLPIPDKEGFLAWVRSGKAFIGMHAAGDTFPKWPEFIEMVGAHFQSHGPQVGVECCVDDPTHPSTAHLGKLWPIAQEEIYLFKNYDRSRVKNLLSLEKHPNSGAAGHFPVAWTREYGQGKVFYTSLGHREDIWDADPNLRDRKNSVEVSKAYQVHILGGIYWALGLRESPMIWDKVAPAAQQF